VNTTSSISDAELILLINNKDPQAFSRLYDKFSAPLYGIIRKLVKDEALALQTLESAFTAVWQQRTTIGLHKESLFICMHNLARDAAMEALNRSMRQQNEWSGVSTYSLDFVSCSSN
jgi:DNA-directed RNA polymerase specialized sigma24 family protein